MKILRVLHQWRSLISRKSKKELSKKDDESKTRVLRTQKLGESGEVILPLCHSASFRCHCNILKLMELFQPFPGEQGSDNRFLSRRQTRTVKSAVAGSSGDGLAHVQSTAYVVVHCVLGIVLGSENGYFKSDVSWLHWLIL